MALQSLIVRSIYLQWLLVQVLPRLRCWPVREWPRVLAEARREEFDRTERIGILIALGLTTWLLKPTDSTLASTVGVYFCALPLLLVLVAPLYVRNIRRGIETLADEHSR